MRKNLLLALMCFISAWIQLTPMYAADSVRDVKEGGYMLWSPLIMSSSQIAVNNYDLHEGGNAETLIDGDINSKVHTVWNAAMQNADITEEQWLEVLKNYGTNDDGSYRNSDAGYHFIQVNLVEPMSEIKFSYKGRNDDFWHDNPNHIVVYGTNDGALGSRLTNKDQDKWTFVKELTPENGNFPENVKLVEAPYYSPKIVAPEAFKYYRFVIKRSTMSYNHPERQFNNPDVTGVTWAVSEFQVYGSTPTDDYSVILPIVVDSVISNSKLYDFQFGTDPGYTKENVYKSYFETLEKCQNKIAFGETDNNVLKDCCKELRNSYANLLENGFVGIETGYYFIENAWKAYKEKQGVTKSMVVGTDRKLIWLTSDHADATQLWYIEKLENGNYSVKNVGSGEYINTVEGAAQHVQMSSSHQTDQLFKPYNDHAGVFHMCNVLNNIDYHSDGHQDGNAHSGRVVTWNGDINTGSVWSLKRLTDQAEIDRLVQQGPNAFVRLEIKNNLNRAKSVISKIYDYDKLITDASQLSSNAPSPGDGSDFKHLIDNNTGSIFHSVWDDAFSNETAVGTSYGWHNLQVRLNKPMSKIKFSYTGRESNDGWHDNPDHITVYATNDDALGESTAAADSSKWTEIVDMTKKNYVFPGNVTKGQFDSPEIDLGGSFKYLRFVVKHTTTLYPGGNRENRFPSPLATGITFNLSEFQIYDASPSESSEYYRVDGMKEAGDLLNDVMAKVESNLANGIILKSDCDLLNNAIAGVDQLYIDRGDIFGQFESLKRVAMETYGNATGARISLIKDESQLRSNSVQGSENEPIRNLIDGDKNSAFHTVWNSTMGWNDITAEKWNEILTNEYPEADGTGYHNLQVELTVPQKSFFFDFFGRIGTEWHDNPDDIEIYATNDAELASDIRDERTHEWTFIKKLNEGFPGDVEIDKVPYTSPTIDLGAEYKYIRFVVKHTTHMGGHDRVFSAPDITGITWNLSEFQMYTGLDPESVQYNYIEEVRVAVDNLKQILDKYEGLEAKDIASKAPVNELDEALAQLKAAYVDTTDVVAIYNNYKAIVPVADVGDGIGYVDSQAEVEKFDAAIDKARALISPKKPTKEQVNGALEGLRSAYATFISHVKGIQPYVWYNILSSSIIESATDQPIHLHQTSLGADLKYGNYPLGEEITDVYAIWRFVPIEGKEGQYAIQSLGTGQYFGPYRGIGVGAQPLMSHEKTPYCVDFCGRGSFKIRQYGLDDVNNYLRTGGDNLIVNQTKNKNCMQEFRFVEVAAETDVVGISHYPTKNINIITLPWANKGENALSFFNADYETYGINNVVSAPGADGEAGETTLTLTAKDEFEAGEPFVLVTKAESEDGKQPLTFAIPANEATAVTDSAISVNGLNGTLLGVNIQDATKLYFDNSALTICGDAPVWISGRGGWIDATQVTDLQGSIDKTITINGMINGVDKIVVEDPNALVNVYTIDGVMVKQNVKAADATKSLAKGIYIVGKKKVLVK